MKKEKKNKKIKLNKKAKIIILVGSGIIAFLLGLIIMSIILKDNKTVGKLLECKKEINEELKVTTTITAAYLDDKFHDFKSITKVDISNNLKSKDRIMDTFKKAYASTEDIDVEITSTDNEIVITQISTSGHSMTQTYSELKEELEKEGYKCK